MRNDCVPCIDRVVSRPAVTGAVQKLVGVTEGVGVVREKVHQFIAAEQELSARTLWCSMETRKIIFPLFLKI